ncbi:MAG: GNAT family N-acetyltransferase [Beijerinckiaceae bacterium]|nr:GNAT family N-acetyltransferase [Beijerinckiaceae bacterium]
MTEAGHGAESPIHEFRIEPLTDLDLLRDLLRRRWGETLMMFGRSWKLGEYEGYVARDEKGAIVGLVTTALQRSTQLALTIDSFVEHKGIGRLLLDFVIEQGRNQGARSLRVLTTNDNTPALRYFQKRGFRIVAFYPGAIAIYRPVFMTLPEIGVDGIPVRDAIELEIDL